MVNNAHEESVSADQVNELRTKFLDAVASNPGDFDQRDVEERVKKNDWYVKRFLLLETKSVDKALAEMVSVFKWRKTRGINDLTPSKGTMPAEAFKNGVVQLWRPDQNGNLTMYIRGEGYKRWPEDLDEDYFLFLLETMDRLGAERKKMGSFIWDARNIGTSNVDIGLARKWNEFIDKYPFLLRYTYIAGFPSLLSPLLKMLVAVFGREAGRDLKTGNMKELAAHNGEANLPWYQQDKDSPNYKEIRVLPRGVPTLRELAAKKGDAKLEKEVEKFCKHLDNYIDESKVKTIDATTEAYVKALVDQA